MVRFTGPSDENRIGGGHRVWHDTAFGRLLEVVEDDHPVKNTPPHMYRVINFTPTDEDREYMGPGFSWRSLFIAKDLVVEVEKEQLGISEEDSEDMTADDKKISNSPDFMPKSGMVFRNKDGNLGLFIWVDGNLSMLISGNYRAHNCYDVWAEFTRESLKEENGYGVVEIYSGMHSFKHFGLNHRLTEAAKPEYLVWSRAPQPKRFVMSLNEDYTAEVTGEEIKVGCQIFKLQTLKELVKKAEEEINA